MTKAYSTSLHKRKLTIISLIKVASHLRRARILERVEIYLYPQASTVFKKLTFYF